MLFFISESVTGKEVIPKSTPDDEVSFIHVPHIETEVLFSKNLICSKIRCFKEKSPASCLAIYLPFDSFNAMFKAAVRPIFGEFIKTILSSKKFSTTFLTFSEEPSLTIISSKLL